MRLKLLFLALIVTFFSCEKNHKETLKLNRTTDFNFNWKFKLLKDTILPKQIPLKDTDWSAVRLPHDWSIEFPFSNKWEGATGYLPGGVGIYQKHFKTPASPQEKNTFIKFDGVYNNATFWINGHKLGFNPYGYSPINFDLTNKLKTDSSDNVLTVHVDHSRYADSRWYTGSGIYRNVKLVTVNKLHIPIWGTFITTPKVSKNRASVYINIEILNQYPENTSFNLETKILDTLGNIVVKSSKALSLNSKTKKTFIQKLEVNNPLLWGPKHPNMYKAVSSISINGEIIDSYTTPFGIRQIEYKAGEGFFLNGKNTYMKGVCLHHDAGLVGTAVPKGVWKRRLQNLKDGGVNAIRTSHNPFSEEFLDLCDEMGFLVQNEIFDELDYAKDKRLNYHDRHDDYITRGYDRYFQDWAKSDLTRTLLRDRNHPAVVQWSIGNEIEWTYLHYRYITGFWPDPKDSQKVEGFWGDSPRFSPEELKKRYNLWEKQEHIETVAKPTLNSISFI